MSNITVVDSLMGTGKTTWVINHLKKTDENFLYITPYLTECDRICEEVNTKRVRQPMNFGKGKIGNLLDLLNCQEDIASTHSLFKLLNAECKDAIRAGDYTLYLDETIDAVREYNPAHKDDIKLLQDKGIISIDSDGYVKWLDDSYSDTSYNEIRTLSENKSLIKVNNKMMVWQYPAEIFKLFKKVYVFTYLFDGSIMKSYFKLNNIEYEKKTLRNYEIVDYFPQSVKRFIPLIDIYQDSDLNGFIPYQKDNVLSATWLRSKTPEKEDAMRRLKNNVYNYFRNKMKASSDNLMWTTYMDSKTKLQGKGYTNGFVACNCRATNDYSDRHYLAYVANIYQKPSITQYFQRNNIEFDAEQYALQTLLQWIWRSAIRNDEQIHIYIPSKRMRRLLTEWLYGGAKMAA